jgi:hypothetical protein
MEWNTEWMEEKKNKSYLQVNLCRRGKRMASHLANGEYGEKVKKQQKIWKKIDYPVDVRKREF